MTDYYFKIQLDKGYYYSCFTAKSYEQAFRNALFACFSYYEDVRNRFKINYPNVEDRYQFLYSKYQSRIHVTTKEIFEEEDQYQTD